MNDDGREAPDPLVYAEDEAASADDYVDRPGYDPTFLGVGYEIPLPTVRGARKNDLAAVRGGGHELRYWTYSVLMSRSRKLPVLSAANFDRDSKSGIDRIGAWVPDPRMNDDDRDFGQVVEQWYRHQNPAGLGRGPFDRGHMTAFENAKWGTEPKRSGIDTFHFTNCAPQAQAFNEHELWREIEVFAAERGTGKVTLFNGPVYDAPVSTVRPDGDFDLDPFGPSSPDKELNGVGVPKLFFKVAVYVKGGELAVQSFLVTQEGYLDTIENLQPAGVDPDDEEALSELELTLYRVPVAMIERLTDLDLGELRLAAAVNEEEAEEGYEIVKSLDDLF